MKFDQYILYSDLDGTLLSSWDRGPIIDSDNMKSIQMFIEKGGLFSIATGRNLKNGPYYLKDIKISLPMVLVNGALIYDSINDIILETIPLSGSVFSAIIDFYLLSNCINCIFSDPFNVYTLIHHSKDTSKLPKIDFETTQITIEELREKNILKITLITHKEELNKIFTLLHTTLPYFNETYITTSSDQFIEIMDKSVNKAEAIRKVVKQEKLKERKLVCIGDNLNDLEMLDLAEIAAIPLNAHTSLHNRGYLLTKHHDSNAVADLIKQLEKTNQGTQ